VIDGSPFQSLSGDKLTMASRQGDKTTTSCDQTRQSRTDDGARDIYGGAYLGSARQAPQGIVNAALASA